MTVFIIIFSRKGYDTLVESVWASKEDAEAMRDRYAQMHGVSKEFFKIIERRVSYGQQ